ncbi:hypothetical protein PR048_033381 [Dryococelus australis]|uniref:Uncharacterized protein n=1 Tax=Dryococelus australis TaxID=614101 RepID=A0ABQ9G3G3_9NEOP|nr:hypothetical protein PR048_033381 [Dryococelus australis]
MSNANSTQVRNKASFHMGEFCVREIFATSHYWRPGESESSMTCRLDSTVLCTNIPVSTADWLSAVTVEGHDWTIVLQEVSNTLWANGYTCALSLATQISVVPAKVGRERGVKTANLGLRNALIPFTSARLDSSVLCTLEPQLCVHWLLSHTWQLWDSQAVSLQVCYWLRGVQGGSNKLSSNCEGDFTDGSHNLDALNISGRVADHEMLFSINEITSGGKQFATKCPFVTRRQKFTSTEDKFEVSCQYATQQQYRFRFVSVSPLAIALLVLATPTTVTLLYYSTVTTVLRNSSTYRSLSCVFIGCCPTPGSYGIRKLFPCKSAIGSEACRAGLINCDPITKTIRRAVALITAVRFKNGKSWLERAGNTLLHSPFLNSFAQALRGDLRYTRLNGNVRRRRRLIARKRYDLDSSGPGDNPPHPPPPLFPSAPSGAGRQLHVGIGRLKITGEFEQNSHRCAAFVRLVFNMTQEHHSALGSPLVDDQPIMNAIKYWVVSGAVWTNRTMVSSNTRTNRTDSTVLCTVEPHVLVHWLLPQIVGSVTPRLAVWDSLLVALQVCYWVIVVQGGCPMNCDPIAKATSAYTCWTSTSNTCTLMFREIREFFPIPILLEATAAERSARSHPTKANRVSIPGWVTEFSQVGIVPEDAVGRRVFSGISRLPPPPSFRRHSIFTSITLIISQDLAVNSRPNLFTTYIVHQ